MCISKISINSFRNLQLVQLDLANNFNLLVGQNGSGKTSFLEAIYFLSLARSFRSHQYKPVIRHGQSQMTVSGMLFDGTALGIEKNLHGKTRLQINREPCHETVALASRLPLQIINPDSYKILEAGPQFRRKFLDWGVFHVKQQFYKCWQRSQQVLAQRNAALRQGYNKQQIGIWDKEYFELAEVLHQMRHEYFSWLQLRFNQLVAMLLNEEIILNYYRGWNDELSLEVVFDKAFERDKQLGYSQYGPHRADILFTINKLPVTQVLSRGQQKLLIFALKIAQGILLKLHKDKSCIYLIDDLPAELDREKRECVLQLLKDLEAQIFVTAIEESGFEKLLATTNSKMFHVKHGDINRVTDKL